MCLLARAFVCGVFVRVCAFDFVCVGVCVCFFVCFCVFV